LEIIGNNWNFLSEIGIFQTTIGLLMFSKDFPGAISFSLHYQIILGTRWQMLLELTGPISSYFSIKALLKVWEKCFQRWLSNFNNFAKTKHLKNLMEPEGRSYEGGATIYIYIWLRVP